MYGGVQPDHGPGVRASCLNVHSHQWRPLACSGTPPTGRPTTAAAFGERLLFGGNNGRKLLVTCELLIDF